MKRSHTYIALAIVAVSLLAFGCRDETDPAYNLKLMYKREWRETALKNIDEIFSTAMRENKNDLNHPEVKKITDALVPGLCQGFKDFPMDPENRKTIIGLLAQMNDPRAGEVFLEGMTMERLSAAAVQTFIVSANAARRQKVKEALPKLLAAWNMVKSARDANPETPFNVDQSHIVQAFISSASGILVDHPGAPEKNDLIDALIYIVDTPDTRQELRLNMTAMQALGRIGDARAVPVLIRGIAQRGTRQPVALGAIAFAALQRIQDRDAVVTGMLAFARGEDAAFNKAYEAELENDPLMKNPLWFIQQTVTFFGQLQYPSKDVISFLMSEFNRLTPDDLDRKTQALELQVQFDTPEEWTQMRRNWAAVALAEIGHVDIVPEMVNRIRFKGNRLETAMEEAVGYFRAMSLLMKPAESCPVLKRAIPGADDSLRDKIFYNASLMCGDNFLPDMDKAIKAINCDKIIKDRFQGEATEEEERQARNECEVMIKRIEGYKERIQYSKECGDDMACHIKTIGDHTNRNIERALHELYRIGRDNKALTDQVTAAIMANLHNPSRSALTAAIRALDLLMPQGGEALDKALTQAYNRFAGQSAYKDRARDMQSFRGRVLARTK